MTEEADPGRRHFLTVATAVTGAAGVGLVSWPFLASMRPSARARALGAPVEVDVSRLDEGALLTIEWRGRPVWLLRRNANMLATLDAVTPHLRDPESSQSEQPEYARNTHRSVRPDLLVVFGSCTHLGCTPLARFDVAPADLGPEWRGGFYCPCHGSTFDLAGRVYAGVPAPTNLSVPPYRFVDDNTVLIGADSGSGA